MDAKRVVTMVTLVAALMVLLAVSSTGAGPPVEGDQGSGKISLAGAVASSFSYQGRLTDSDGVPLRGSHNLVFQLWDDASAGSQVGGEIVRDDVDTMTNGLFTVELAVPEDTFIGQALWLRIEVDGQWLSPRQELLPVPYALSLRPGAAVHASKGLALLNLTNEGAGSALDCVSVGPGAALDAFSATGDAVAGEAQSADRSGVYGHSVDGFGVTGRSTNTIGVYGETSSRDLEHAGVTGRGVYRPGVLGLGWTGVVGEGTGFGVQGKSETGTGVEGTSFTSSGVWGESSSGPGIVGWSTSAEGVRGSSVEGAGVAASSYQGDPIQAYGADWIDGDIEFKVDNDGDVYADRAYHDWGADFADMLAVAGDVAQYEPGDVLAIGPDGLLVLAQAPYATNVPGVYSTQPGFVGGDGDDQAAEGKIALALVGAVPVKVSAENGPIAPGDLLSTSSTASHAMRADNPPPGTILGKALGELESGTGVIDVLVTLQ